MRRLILIVLTLFVSNPAFAVQSNVSENAPTEFHCRGVSQGVAIFEGRISAVEGLIAIDKNGVFVPASIAYNRRSISTPAERALLARSEAPETITIMVQGSQGQIRMDVFKHDEMAASGAGAASVRANGIELTCGLPQI